MPKRTKTWKFSQEELDLLQAVYQNHELQDMVGVSDMSWFQLFASKRIEDREDLVVLRYIADHISSDMYLDYKPNDSRSLDLLVRTINHYLDSHKLKLKATENSQ
jgi:hypothetical protein